MGIKKSKNARRMQMVFFVHTGKVHVEVANREFSISKGGIWQVPRGMWRRRFALLSTFNFSVFVNGLSFRSCLDAVSHLWQPCQFRCRPIINMHICGNAVNRTASRNIGLVHS